MTVDISTDRIKHLHSLGNADYIHLALVEERDKLKQALERFIYETTSLSQEEDDGSHRCYISKQCLENGRTLIKDKT